MEHLNIYSWTYDRFNDHLAYLSIREIIRLIDGGNYVLIDDNAQRLCSEIIDLYSEVDRNLRIYGVPHPEICGLITDQRMIPKGE
jgi:hypothetical protein